MKKFLLFMIALLTGVSGAWATDVTWTSGATWSLGTTAGNASFTWFSATTPLDDSAELTLSAFTIQLGTGGQNADARKQTYLIVADHILNSNTCTESDYVCISTATDDGTSVETTYSFNDKTLTGGTTYYFYFAQQDGDNYNLVKQRVYVQTGSQHGMLLGQLGTSTTGFRASNSNDWTIPFSSTLTTTATTTNYTYTCVNLAGYTFGSGNLELASTPTSANAPAISGYTYSSITVDGTNVTFKYALTTNPITSLVTAAGDIDSNPTYLIIGSIVSRDENSTFYYYAEDGGAVKGNYAQSSNEDASHWVIVGNETDGYKFYNGLFGSAKVAQAASSSSGAAITMVDAASNDGTLFDLRYISGAYRFYYKGTANCTNRLSSSTKVIGIHSNVNAGSATSVLKYYANALYKQYDINTAKTYTIKSGARGYLFANASGYVANNFSSTAESAAADANYQWAFVQATNGKYYLYNVGQQKFFGKRTSEDRAAVSSLATTDWIYLTSTKSTSYYPLYLTGTGYNTSTYADISARYVNAQGESGDNNSVVYNSYYTLDGGNDFLITELNNFSAADQQLARNTLRTLTGGLRAEHAASLLGAVEEACWKVYTIKGPLGTLEANGEGTYLTNTGKSGSTVAPTTNTSQQWVLVYTGESYLLYNVGADKYLSGNGSNNYALVDRASASAVTFRASTTGTASVATILNFPVGIEIGSDWLNLNNGTDYAYGTTTYNHAEDPNNMFRIEELNGPCYLTTGFYRLKNKLTTDSYGYMGVSGEQLVGNISDVNDASTILYIDKNGEGKYSIRTQGKYTGCVRKSNEVALMDVAPAEAGGDNEAFTISSKNGYLVIRTHADGDYSHYHAASGNSYKIVGWETASDATLWQLKKATSLNVTLHRDVAGDYYATFCAPFSYTVEAGAKAYTSELRSGWLDLTEVEGAVTAGTPVLLKGSSATATLTIGSEYEATPLTTTALKGVYFDTDIEGGRDYFLGLDEHDAIGFYHWEGTTLNANRAYLVSDDSFVKGFTLNFNLETAIDALNAQEAAQGSIFNLAGQRMNKLQRGVNILNGKKVIVK